jgi:lysophospholipase L1-like esterase
MYTDEMNTKKLVFRLCCLITCSTLSAGCTTSTRDDPFAEMQQVTPELGSWHEPQIQAFEESDAKQMPAPGQALFIGSSSIRMWKSLAEDMSPVPVINRGFGGSTTPEVLAVFDRIVKPYAPSIIVYYCGDNDLGTENTDSESAAMGFIQFDRLARETWPDVQTIYIPIKPSLARWSNWDAMERANEIVRSYCEMTDGVTYADTASPTLLENGQPDPAIFLGDGLHMNERGYEIWTGVLRPIVLDAWSETRRDD